MCLLPVFVKVKYTRITIAIIIFSLSLYTVGVEESLTILFQICPTKTLYWIVYLSVSQSFISKRIISNIFERILPTYTYMYICKDIHVYLGKISSKVSTNILHFAK